MRKLRSLSSPQLARAESRLLHPAPGSRVEAAAALGIDVTLLIEQLRLTPEQRAAKLEAASTSLEQFRGILRKSS